MDPAEELTALFFTQAFTAKPLPVREGLRQLVYQALVDRPPVSLEMCGQPGPF